MSEKDCQDTAVDEDEGFLVMKGALLDLDSIESAIDALARDEAAQAHDQSRTTPESSSTPAGGDGLTDE